MLPTTLVVIVVTILSAHQLVDAADHWSYNNVEKWPGVCSTGKFQSPIDLVKNDAIEKSFNPFQFNNYDRGYQATMKNNKHSVEVRLNTTNLQTPSVSGGSFPDVYMLDHMHFHWKSEHTVNGRRFPLELHLVHYNRDYGSLLKAKQHKDGIAVLGVLFNISPDDDSDLEPLFEIIDNIGKNPDKTMPLETIFVPKNFLPCDTAGFFRYSGSLTTPGCDEVVIWTIFTDHLTISEKQVKEFETIQSDEGPLLKNYRSVQPLNGRSVLLKVSPINASSRTLVTSSLMLMLSVLFALKW